jgi:hypothetical protein
MADLLPPGKHLSSFHAFFKTATLLRDGTANLTFLVPEDQKAALLDLSRNDGMALLVDVHETVLPEGEDWLAAAIGLAPAPPTIVAKS